MTVKRELKEDYAETTLDPETIEDVRSRRGVKIQSNINTETSLGNTSARITDS